MPRMKKRLEKTGLPVCLLSFGYYEEYRGKRPTMLSEGKECIPQIHGIDTAGLYVKRDVIWEAAELEEWEKSNKKWEGEESKQDLAKVAKEELNRETLLWIGHPEEV